MVEKNKKIFQVECTGCHTLLWIDPIAHKVLKSEKVKRKKDSLDEMLLKEKKREKGFARKFDATAELQETKRREAQEKFKKAFDRIKKQQ